MDDQLRTTYKRLKQIRERKDLKVRPNPYLAETFVGIDGIERPLQLRYYQVQGLLHLVAMKRFVLGDDTGLGKTLETIAALTFLWAKEPDKKAIVLTTKSAVNQWAGEFEKFTQGVNVILAKGTPKKREEAYREFWDSGGPTVLVMNYALARVDFSQMQEWGDYILVMDEVTAVKSTSTQIHKVCRHLTTQAYRSWGLTATLIKNNLIEGYGIYRVVNPKVFNMSKTDFMRKFCVTRLQPLPNGKQARIIVGYRKRDIQEFRGIIDPHFLGRPKHEVAQELPSLICRQVEVGLTREQRLLYAEALSDLLQIGEEEGADLREITQLTRILYCQQIVNHPSLIERDGESEKFQVLQEILTSGDLSEEKVILFSRFKKMVNIIVPALNSKHKDKSRYCVRITGDENSQEREEARKLFQDPNSDTRVICITMAGSDAINLQAARAVVFYDTPWSAGDYLQILGRMVRIGSIHDSVYSIHMVGKGTVDAKVMKVLMTKMALVEGVLGKKIKGVEEDDDFQIPSESGTRELFDSLRKDAERVLAGDSL